MERQDPQNIFWMHSGGTRLKKGVSGRGATCNPYTYNYVLRGFHFFGQTWIWGVPGGSRDHFWRSKWPLGASRDHRGRSRSLPGYPAHAKDDWEMAASAQVHSGEGGRIRNSGSQSLPHPPWKHPLDSRTQGRTQGRTSYPGQSHTPVTLVRRVGGYVKRHSIYRISVLA